jgi:hypothetical protein
VCSSFVSLIIDCVFELQNVSLSKKGEQSEERLVPNPNENARRISQKSRSEHCDVEQSSMYQELGLSQTFSDEDDLKPRAGGFQECCEEDDGDGKVPDKFSQRRGSCSDDQE